MSKINTRANGCLLWPARLDSDQTLTATATTIRTDNFLVISHTSTFALVMCEKEEEEEEVNHKPIKVNYNHRGLCFRPNGTCQPELSVNLDRMPTRKPTSASQPNASTRSDPFAGKEPTGKIEIVVVTANGRCIQTQVHTSTTDKQQQQQQHATFG